MSKELILSLENKLNTLTKALPNVTGKKMFGCHALWTRENVFALVWKTGRIGVKLPDETSFERLLGIAGAEPWKAGTMKMAHWVLVPTNYHDNTVELKKWLCLAHSQCSKLEKKTKPKPKKKSK